ncbi:MAG TPA: helix-turn-helix transcriptional regulator [Pirellulales bacterium]|nr:helix-turn-helix transcriptional regulator [Pirellulales bacterium]HVA46280.1 helix-turn-helix transcriptional regulator [Pirellulales bacterium]
MAKRKTTIKHAQIVEQFAARLRQVRSSRGMTQVELARQAHVAVSYVWKLESGAAAPGIDLLGRLAGALGTTAHDLLPLGGQPDSLATLRNRAKALFDDLLQSADEPTLTMLCPLLARLGESPTRRR